jgi:hypothetical protein
VAFSLGKTPINLLPLSYACRENALAATAERRTSGTHVWSGPHPLSAACTTSKLRCNPVFLIIRSFLQLGLLYNQEAR